MIFISDIKSGIYYIENLINNKKYIGQSNNIKDRWRRHISELNKNKHHNDYLQKSWNKYGENNFMFEIIEYCSIENLDDREQYWIDFYNTMDRDFGYNLKTGGQNGGSIMSDETKEKMSISVKNSYNNSNLRKTRSLNALEQWANPIIKEKILGKNNGMYGKHHSEESKKKMSEHSKGRKSWRRNTTPILCVETNIKYDDATDVKNKLGYDSSGILKACRGEFKTSYGYHWKFIND